MSWVITSYDIETKLTLEYKENETIDVLPWSSRSPDLSSIGDLRTNWTDVYAGVTQCLRCFHNCRMQYMKYGIRFHMQRSEDSSVFEKRSFSGEFQ